MSFVVGEVKGYSEMEAEVPSGGNLPTGTYHMAVSAESSEVMEKNGLPYLRIASKVLNGEHEGRQSSEFLRWYASEESDSKNPIEEREKTIRGMTKRWFLNYLKGVADSPTAEQETADSVIDALNSMGDNPVEIREQFETLYTVLDGVEYFGKQKTWENKKTGREDSRLQPVIDWEKGMAAAGVDDGEDV